MTQGSIIQEAFVSGELSPAMWGRVSHEKYKFGASTMRNGFVNFQGGYASRAGSAFVGQCKQASPFGGATLNNAGVTPVNTGPPRPIPFQFNISQAFDLEFGDYYMRVIFQGAYVTETAKTITSVSNLGLFTTSTTHGYSVGDWIYDVGNSGFSGLTWIVKTVPTTSTFTVTDLFGNTISAAIVSAGGTVARIYTVTTPYAAVDLPYLKYTQSADKMSFACWNQNTLTEYPPYDLTRIADNNWSFAQVSFESSISPPTNISVAAESSATTNTQYSYVVTSISGQKESIASQPAYVKNNDISVNAGSNVVTWSPVSGADFYNIYQATPLYNTGAIVPQVGIPYAFVGTANGTTFIDTNVTADFSKTPPLHIDPFARKGIVGVTVTAAGTGYTQATVGYTVTTSTGSGFSGTPIVLSGGINGFYITDTGSGYAVGDSIAITGGTGATVTITLGPSSGTYPGSVAYFDQRRVYASTQNNPDTYYMTQPGDYTNMDSSNPSEPDDAIIGTPWAQQVNGVQFMTPMTGGLVIFTGGGAWQLSGGGSSTLTPADQFVQPQTRYGSSSTVQPIPINFHILFVREGDGVVYDLLYNFFAQVYTGTDITVFSSHLFQGYQIVQWAYSEKPYKLVWAVRNDGAMLSMTYISEQAENGWARHDTNGLYINICTIQEDPVDAVYVIVQRYVQGQWLYYHERFDNRLWNSDEDAFCVDAGLAYPMTFPAATLTPAAADGTDNITSTHVVFGGSGYTAPTAAAFDSSGVGSDATFSVTVVGGVITAVTPITTGQDYTAGLTSIIITDSTGSGAVVTPIITNNVIFTASSGVFDSGNIGDVIRVGNGQATITSYTSSTSVIANITSPITNVLQNDPRLTPVPAISGTWSITTPTTVVSGLNHLNGLTVTGLADGGVISPSVVTNGKITLPVAASAITVGLPFLPQLQSLYVEFASAGNTMQTKRKTIPSVGIRVHNTRGVSVGSNQPDASTQPGNVNVPWTNMQEVKERDQLIPMGDPIPLFTGDYFKNIGSDWNVKGQIAFQQSFPLPMNVDCFVSYIDSGDTPG